MKTARDPQRKEALHSVPGRAGFSLLEVILATAILMGSAVVLSRLAWMGRTQSQRAEVNAEAHQICERILSEVLLGLRSTDTVEQEPLWPVSPGITDSVESVGTLNTGRFGSLDPGQEDPIGAGAAELSQTGEPLWLHTIRVVPHQRLPGLAVLTVEVVQRPQSAVRPARIRLERWIHSPGEGQEQQAGMAVFTAESVR